VPSITPGLVKQSGSTSCINRVSAFHHHRIG
jgi:hypothetical protein